MSDDMTKDELKEQAREQGLPVSGTKEELIGRLEGADTAAHGANSSADFAARQAAERESAD